MHPPAPREFLKGCQEFEKKESRDAIYKTADFLMRHYWPQPAKIADSLGVLLLVWNQAFYRYGPFSFTSLEKAVERHISLLKAFRARNIASYSEDDDENIRKLFADFSIALKIHEGKPTVKGRKSPVGVAKALHLMAPSFFPLWDDKIARAYKCYYSDSPVEKYISFIRICKAAQTKLTPHIGRTTKPFTKLFDEYNYAKFTKGWV